MPKVYLSPAYHYFNTCAVPGCDETTHNNLYLDELEPFLRACGIQYQRGPRRVPRSEENADTLMIDAVAASNAWGADVHYISHTNAFDGTVRGYRPIIYPGSAEGKRLAECIMARRGEIYDQPMRLNERAELYELRATKAVAYYEEHVFHDNLADAAWFHGHLRDIARQTARGLCDYFGISYVEPYGGKPEEAAPAEKGVQSGEDAVVLPSLRQGESGAAVTAAQVLLAGRGYSPGAADGIFGPQTANALARYQQSVGLAVSGLVDRATWKMLLGV